MTTTEQAKQVSKTLREYRNYKLICTLAADTIDALAAENTRLSTLADSWNFECDELREDNKRLAAENERLREALKGLVSWADDIRRDDPAADLAKARAALGETKS